MSIKLKKALSMLLAVVMILGMAPVIAVADEPESATVGASLTLSATQMTSREFIDNISGVIEYDGHGVTVTVSKGDGIGGNDHGVSDDGYQLYYLGNLNNTRTTDITIKNVKFVYEQVEGVTASKGQLYAYTSAKVTFENCIFENVGVSMHGATDTASIKIDHCTFSGYDDYAIKYVGDAEITNCSISNCERALLAESKNADDVAYIKFNNNAVSGMTQKRIIKFYNFVTSNTSSNEIIGNTFTDCTAYLIQVTYDGSRSNEAEASESGIYNIAYSGNTGIEDSKINDTQDNKKTLNHVGDYLVDELPNYVAQIVGGNSYATLAEAVSAVPTDGTPTTITVLSDIDLGTGTSNLLQIPATANLTLDLNGFVISGSTNGVRMINNFGTLVIKDSSMSKTGEIKNISDGKNDCTRTLGNGTDDNHTARMTIESGKISSTVGQVIINQGNLTIKKDAVLETTATYSGNYSNGAVVLDNRVQGVVVIDGATLTSENGMLMYVYQGSDVTIKGGMFTAKATRGLIGGSGAASVKISGGTFNIDPSAMVAHGCYVEEADGLYTVIEMDKTLETVSNEEELSQALSMASATESVEITVSGDITVQSTLELLKGSTIVIPKNNSLTIADDGVLIVNGIVENEGTLTIAENGFLANPLSVEGNGTFTYQGYDAEAETYSISTPMDLQWLAVVNSGDTIDDLTVELANDVTFPEDVVFQQIPYFCGVFDGRNHKISGLVLNGVSSYTSVFAGMSYATIKNVTFDETVTSNNGTVGGIVGYIKQDTHFENVKTTGSITVEGSGYGAAGFVGVVSGTDAAETITFENCESSMTISAPNAFIVGGFYGTASGNYTPIYVTDCTYSGTMASGGYCGTVGGYMSYNATGKTYVYGHAINGAVSGVYTTGKELDGVMVLGADGHGEIKAQSKASVGTKIYDNFGDAVTEAHTNQKPLFLHQNMTDAVNVELIGNDDVFMVQNNGKTANLNVTLQGEAEGKEVKTRTDTNITVYYVGDATPTYVAQIGETGYETLEAAFAAAQDGDTITLISDVALTDYLQKYDSGSVTIDLNGHNISHDSNYIMFYVYNGTLTIKNTAGTKGKITTTSGAFDVDGTYNVNDNPVLNIESGVNIEATTYYCVGVFGSATLNTAGNLKATNDFTITGNGTPGNEGTVINITGGKVENTYSAAIYHPQNGTLTISDAEVNGPTAINIKSGKLTINDGAKIIATWDSTTDNGSYTNTETKIRNYKYNGAGCSPMCVAVQIENIGYPGGAPVVEIKGGEILTSSDNYNPAVASHVAQDDTTNYSGSTQYSRVTGFITGGTFSTKPEAEYIAEGYTAVQNTDGSYTVKPKIQWFNTWNPSGPYYFDDEDPIPSRTTQLPTPTIKRYGDSSYHAVEENVTITWAVTDKNADSPEGADTAIATVNEDGIVTFSAPGTVKAWIIMTDETGTKTKGTTISYKIAPAYTVSNDGQTKTAHTSLYAAFNAVTKVDATENKIVMCSDYSATNIGKMTLNADREITIDLNGHTASLNANYSDTTFGALFTVKKGTLNIINSEETGGITASGKNARAFNVDGKSNSSANDAVLNIGEGVSVSSVKDSSVTIFGKATLNTAGTLTSTESFAIAGNGSDGNGGTVINVTGGTISGDEVAIYHPQSGALNISGGTITGATAVYQKSGTLNITGGTLNGTGDAAAYSYNGNGANATGDALVIDNCGYPGGTPSANIKDATINSTNGKQVGYYVYNDNAEGTVLADIEYTLSTNTDKGWVADSSVEGYSYTIGVVPDYVAQIGDTKYTTLNDAFDAAETGDTIQLIADATMDSRVFVNAGAKTLDSGSRYATTSDTRSITLDLNEHNISGESNIALAGGSLNVTGTGTISTSTDGLAPIEVRGTGDLTAKRTLTIGSNVTLTGSTYGLNIFGSNNEQANKIDVTVNGTVNGQLFVLGNLKNTSNAINIVVNDSAKLYSIAENGYANVTINGGSFTETTNSCVEVRAGTLTINGGTFTNTAESFSCTSNGSGTTTKGAAIAIAQHTTDKPINVTINGGTFTGPCALSIANPQNNATNNVTVSVTGGYFKGTTSTVAQTVKNDDNRVTSFISGGIFYNDAVNSGDPSIKGTGYVASGYEAVLLTSTNTTDTDHIGWYQVGEVKTTAVTETTTAEQENAGTKQFTATKTVVNEEQQTLATNNTITINVTGTTEESAPTEEKTVTASTSLSNIKDAEIEKIVSSVVAAADTDNSIINVKIEIVSDTPQVENIGTSMPTITYEIHPEAVAYEDTTKVGSTKITNSQLAEGMSFTLKLKVPNEVYEAAKEEGGFKLVNVVHKKDDGTIDTYSSLNVSGTSGAYYVTITGVSSFSDFELTPVSTVTTGSGSHTFTLSLKDSIDINLYYYNLASGTSAANYTVEATFYNRATSQNETKTFALSSYPVSGADGWYKMTVASAAACQVADVVTIVLKYNGEQMETYTYSVKQYCESMCGKSDVSSELKNICKAVLDYGTMAQLNFDYNTSNLANTNYSDWGVGQSVTVPTYANTKAVAPFQVIKTLTLKSKTEVNFYVEMKDGMTFAATIGSEAADIETTEVSGYYKVRINGIAATKLGETITLTVSYGGVGYVYTYSALSYAASMQDNASASAELKNVCKALYLYNQAAIAYFESIQ